MESFIEGLMPTIKRVAPTTVVALVKMLITPKGWSLLVSMILGALLGAVEGFIQGVWVAVIAVADNKVTLEERRAADRRPLRAIWGLARKLGVDVAYYPDE